MTDSVYTRGAAPGIAESALTSFILLVARVMIGLIFVLSGGPKMLNYSATVANQAQRGIPQFLAYLGPPVEFFGGLALIFGVLIPYTALVMFLFMIIATVSSHRYWEFTDPAQYRIQNTNFWKNVAMTGGILLLWVTGAGRWSVDRMLFRRG
jgi:putative oxidoreductase